MEVQGVGVEEGGKGVVGEVGERGSEKWETGGAG